ncbi:hypothetical protein EDEG_02255 [Edhazardia aedis USNM 41457]|uniref:RNA helicase n=1 Tax=Edhazardia aedis (strain USNM 41457) TaxID=1003232 RepID=J8ZUN7_EDHAE|nr:hypothetical protein EDEG_02255 [Edhazardia aedis USNM 41457]|eukprot:EJW03398.1 hypothetical protein EDEG_02255 [Edhazardia aedis USNM 41457]
MYDDYNRKRKTDTWSQSKRPQRSNANTFSASRETVAPRENSPITNFRKEFLRADHSKMEKSKIDAFRAQSKMNIKGTDIPAPVDSFDEVPLFNSQILSEFKKQGYTKPTAIQAQGWTMALNGRDMVGIAQTGSGKTLSFVLPALIHAADQPKLRQYDGPIVLILAPTRELVLQINEVVNAYKRYFSMRSTTIYGGVSSYPQKQDLRDGVEIVVATPGRLIDLYNQGCFSLSRVTFLVLDEADRMLDMGFEPQLKQIIPKTNPDRQTLMWSATWPREVKSLALNYMKDFIQVNIGEDDLAANKNIEQRVICIENHSKKTELIKILRKYIGADNRNTSRKKIIVFCNTKRMCDNLEYFLEDERFYAIAIHGDKSQNARDKVIYDFKSGRKNILIATDVAARGLDVKDVFMVINYDFPKLCEDYVHRIGRTARGENTKGISISFFTYEDKGNARELVKLLTDSGSEVPSELREMIPRETFKKFRRW